MQMINDYALWMLLNCALRHPWGKNEFSFVFGLKLPSRYSGLVKASFYTELLLHLSGIEHTRTKVRRPQINGSVERLNQTIQSEFYQVAFRKKLYHSMEEIQADLDVFIDCYNN